MKSFTTKIILTMALLFLVAIPLAGCDEKDPLIATWQEPESGITMQFKDDGNLVISNQKTSVTLTYQKQDPNVLLIKGTTDGTIPDQTLVYRFEEEKLILTVDNVDTIFTAIK